jgi:hypothetical protein
VIGKEEKWMEGRKDEEEREREVSVYTSLTLMLYLLCLKHLYLNLAFIARVQQYLGTFIN